MPNEPNGPPQSGGPHAYRPASPDIPDIPLADVEVPEVPVSGPGPVATDPSRQVVSNPDGTSPFGPDTPNVRDDDPKAATETPETLQAPLPRPPAEPLREDQIAPDDL